jgi:hypothetical protein
MGMRFADRVRNLPQQILVFVKCIWRAAGSCHDQVRVTGAQLLDGKLRGAGAPTQQKHPQTLLGGALAQPLKEVDPGDAFSQSCPKNPRCS